MMAQKTAVILARVSGKSQEVEGYSLEAQVKLMQSYCVSRELKIAHIFKVTESASKSEQRRVFQQAMSYIADKQIKDLVVEKVDRHVRNLHDATATHDWLMADEERRVHFVKDTLIMHKNSRSQEWLNWGIRVVMAKNYIDNLREEAMKGWSEKLAQGWMPASAPPGYMTVLRDGKKIHVPDPATKGIIQGLFELYLEPSQSIATIEKQMYVRGIRTRKGRPYVKSKVQKMLTNPFYIGTIRFNGADYPGAHETFITKDLFRQVQLKMHGKQPVSRRQHNPLFKNLIHCSVCEGNITWQIQKGRYYGFCQRLKKECKGRKALREDKIEAAVTGMLNDLVCPRPEIIDWVSQELQKRESSQTETNEHTLRALNAQIDRLGRMDSELYDDKLAGEISREVYESKHAHFMAQKAELEANRVKIELDTASDLNQRLALLNLSQKAAEIFQTRTVEQKRLIITKLFSDITSYNGSVSVTYTNFVSVIADKTVKTKEIIGG